MPLQGAPVDGASMQHISTRDYCRAAGPRAQEEGGLNVTPATVSTEAWSHVPVPLISTVVLETCAANNAAVHACPMFPVAGEYSKAYQV